MNSNEHPRADLRNPEDEEESRIFVESSLDERSDFDVPIQTTSLKSSSSERSRLIDVREALAELPDSEIKKDLSPDVLKENSPVKIVNDRLESRKTFGRFARWLRTNFSNAFSTEQTPKADDLQRRP